MTEEWPFAENKKTMVLTTQSILDKNKQVLAVWHDKEDGLWQFLDGSDVNEEDAKLVSLEEILEIDNSLSELSDLPIGWVAWRSQKGADWLKKENI